jgi:L-2-hydroxycarboxylate dehydrogenase (NAD+)
MGNKPISYIVSDCGMVLVSLDECRAVALSVLAANGVPEAYARTQVELLIDAELRGVPSHGLLRFERIVARILNGVANAQTQGHHTWRGDAFLSVDGQNGLGPVVAQHAVEAISERAKTTGIAVAAIANNNHIGMLAWYAETIAEAGQVAIIVTTSEAQSPSACPPMAAHS